MLGTRRGNHWKIVSRVDTCEPEPQIAMNTKTRIMYPTHPVNPRVSGATSCRNMPRKKT